MELGNLKQAWKQEERKQIKTPNIMELIHQKSKGPIASLKSSFRKQMVVVLIAMSCILFTQVDNLGSVFSNVLVCVFFGFCLVSVLTFYFNYRLTIRMEKMDSDVISHLTQHVALLEQRLKWQAISELGLIILFFMLLEAIPFFQHIKIIDIWHTVSPIIRFCIYAVYLVLRYFIYKGVTRKKFGTHIDNLKAILKDAE